MRNKMFMKGECVRKEKGKRFEKMVFRNRREAGNKVKEDRK
jgi:hypothetical protein